MVFSSVSFDNRFHDFIVLIRDAKSNSSRPSTICFLFFLNFEMQSASTISLVIFDFMVVARFLNSDLWLHNYVCVWKWCFLFIFISFMFGFDYIVMFVFVNPFQSCDLWFHGCSSIRITQVFLLPQGAERLFQWSPPTIKSLYMNFRKAKNLHEQVKMYLLEASIIMISFFGYV